MEHEMTTEEDIAHCRYRANQERSYADHLLDLATQPGQGSGVVTVLIPLIDEHKARAIWWDRVADGGGFCTGSYVGQKP